MRVNRFSDHPPPQLSAAISTTDQIITPTHQILCYIHAPPNKLPRLHPSNFCWLKFLDLHYSSTMSPICYIHYGFAWILIDIEEVLNDFPVTIGQDLYQSDSRNIVLNIHWGPGFEFSFGRFFIKICENYKYDYYSETRWSQLSRNRGLQQNTLVSLNANLNEG